MKKALGLGILGSFFFAFTFILNRSMNLSGGFWMWSAVLRYVYTLPILAVILWKNHQMREILEEIREKAGLLDFMEHGRLRAFLCTAVTCLYVWGIVADCIDLADYDRSGGQPSQRSPLVARVSCDSFRGSGASTS